MRLVAQSKGGFYPAPTEVVRTFGQRLRIADPHHTYVLDPCCGQAEALGTLVDAAGIPERNAYAVEIEEERSATAGERLPQTHILANTDFLGTTISPKSFSIIWLNPPFDDEYGGGQRVEGAFLFRATLLLTKGGILAFVLPQTVLENEWEIRHHLAMWYSGVASYAFPAEHRRFGELLVVGARKDEPDHEGRTESALLDVREFSELRDRQVPPGRAPARFEKSAPTHDELIELLEHSPLVRLTEPPALRPPTTPPLPLNTGHVALLLASGQIDGVVQPEGEPPHVVRGVARKSEYLAEVTEDEDEEGTLTTRSVYRQRIELVVRAVDRTGVIHDFE